MSDIYEKTWLMDSEVHFLKYFLGNNNLEIHCIKFLKMGKVAHVCHLLHSIPISFDSKAAATQEDEGDLIERNLLPIIAFCRPFCAAQCVRSTSRV